MESLLDLLRVLGHTSSLIDAKRYDYIDLLRDDLDLLHESVVRKIFEIQRCLKCKKESTEYQPYLVRATRRRSVRSVG